LLNRAIEQGRADDTEEVIRHRLDVYAAETAPLISVYAARGLVVLVDGLGIIDDVTDRILEALNARGLAN
jgi:adenylate kinase